MSDMVNAADVALRAVEALYDWSRTILDKLEAQIEEELGDHHAFRRMYPEGGSKSPTVIPWIGIAVQHGISGKDIWGSGSPPTSKGGFFIISYQDGKGPGRGPRIQYGTLSDVRRKKGQHKSLDIYRQILGHISKNSQKAVETDHATASATITACDFFKHLDPARVQGLVEEVGKIIAGKP